MTRIEIEKALYKEKPPAIKTGSVNVEGVEHYVYKAMLEDDTPVNFSVPTNDMGENTFKSTMPAQYLRRWLTI